jgi:hypothetical protein
MKDWRFERNAGTNAAVSSSLQSGTQVLDRS